MQPKAKSQGMDEAADDDLGLRPFAFNAAHILATPLN
jgi:hypothetical protein